MGNKETKIELNEEDMTMLMSNTDFTPEQILEWYDEFRRECPDGYFDRKKFAKFYGMLLPENGRSEEFLNLVFHGNYFFCAFFQDLF